MENNEYDFYLGKKTEKTYISKRIISKSPKLVDGKIELNIEHLRYASKVIDSENLISYVKEKGKIILRTTPEGRQEITAKFLEDSRRIYTLNIQKFTTETGSPHKTYFSFRGDEIKVLVDFIKSVKEIDLENSNGKRINDEDLKKLILTKNQAYSIYKENEVLFKEVLEENVTENEVLNLIYKKNELAYFEKLLNEESFFSSEKTRLNISKDESLWQHYFEKNTWIFGYGLEYIINIPLENKKLEQVVDGYDIVNRGKRIDALMKSKGIVNHLCFAEIKTHKTKLLNSAYRPNVFPPTNELSGGISQIHKTVQSSLENLTNRITPADSSGNPTGEDIFLYKPKSFLLVGSLQEFETENGVNKEKYSSFELYRNSIKDIEIITFDELLERAKFILEINH